MTESTETLPPVREYPSCPHIASIFSTEPYGVKEQATRILTAKLRAERLVREAMSGKRDQKKSAKAQAENHRLAVIAAGRWRHVLSRQRKSRID